MKDTRETDRQIHFMAGGVGVESTIQTYPFKYAANPVVYLEFFKQKFVQQIINIKTAPEIWSNVNECKQQELHHLAAITVEK